MIGMPIGKKTPKSELHEFYQLHPGNPAFTIKSMSNPPAEPLFLCTLTCPGIGGPQGLPEQSFTGQGRNKKTAEQYAAEKALGFLRQRGLMAPALVEMAAQQLPPDLQRQLAGTSTQTITVSSSFQTACIKTCCILDHAVSAHAMLFKCCRAMHPGVHVHRDYIVSAASGPSSQCSSEVHGQRTHALSRPPGLAANTHNQW